MNIFEQAARVKLRIPARNNFLMVEDLWDLPLTSKTKISLDELAIQTHRKIESSGVISFVEGESKVEKADQLTMDILKHVISVRQAENSEKLRKQELRQQAELLDELIAKKEQESLLDKPLEELVKQRQALELH